MEQHLLFGAMGGVPFPPHFNEVISPHIVLVFFFSFDENTYFTKHLFYLYILFKI